MGSAAFNRPAALPEARGHSLTQARLRRASRFLLVLGLLASSFGAQAGCSGDGPRGGLLNMDRCDEFEASGIYARRNQQRLDQLLIVGAVGTALWQGTETDLGRTAWKSVDAMATAAVTTEVMKAVFQRPRPRQSDNLNLWHQGSGNKSFPSGETAMVSAFVTPLIMDWQDEHPAVWGLALLPVYMGKARMGSQGHWLSDVLVGGAVGLGAGYLAGKRESPLILAPLPGGGVYIGLRHRF